MTNTIFINSIDDINSLYTEEGWHQSLGKANISVQCRGLIAELGDIDFELDHDDGSVEIKLPAGNDSYDAMLEAAEKLKRNKVVNDPEELMERIRAAIDAELHA